LLELFADRTTRGRLRLLPAAAYLEADLAPRRSDGRGSRALPAAGFEAAGGCRLRLREQVIGR